MKHILTKVLLAALTLGITFVDFNAAHAQNIALHKNVTVGPESNYGLTVDKNPAQLTDGIYASSQGKWNSDNMSTHLWTKKGTLGWRNKEPIDIIIDLGENQPISGVIYSTAAGLSGVDWPQHIYIGTSTDKVNWHYVGDLAQLTQTQPPQKGYANFRYEAHDLKTHGRYVALEIISEKYAFVDEIEILRGDDALLHQPAGREIPKMSMFVTDRDVTTKAKQRQYADVASIHQKIQKSNLPRSQKIAFTERLNKNAKSIENTPELTRDFKTIIPITETHKNILAIHGQTLAAQGFDPLTLWKKHRYAWQSLINTPDVSKKAELNFSMLGNQFRSDSILMTNASGQSRTVTLKLENPPTNAKAGWLQIYSAIWTDTFERVPVQSALIPLEDKKGAYTMDIPAGVTGKLWVTIDSSKLPAGSTKSTLNVASRDQQYAVPFNINVSVIEMKKPRMHLGVWDYSTSGGKRAITPKNRRAAIQLMKSHFVDSPWASWIFPYPEEKDFNTENQLITELDFSKLDQWMELWPDARNYMVYFNVKSRSSFAGAEVGTPRFEARLGNWVKSIAEHIEKQGIQSSRLALLLSDEPRSDAADLPVVHWGGVIKKAAPQIRIFSDPTWDDPTEAKYPQALALADIICPLFGRANNAYYKDYAHTRNKELWFYNADEGGMHHTGDPQLAYRQMAWRVFAAGGKGEGFWSFSDTRGAPTSWNAYSSSRAMYAPAFFDTDTVYNSLHWEAVREGIEDFEELSMLKDSLDKTENALLKEQAQQVLGDAIEIVTSNEKDNNRYLWQQDINPATVDLQLARVREVLLKLSQ